MGRKFFNQIADQFVNCFECSADRLLALFADAEGAIMENAAFLAFGFHDAITGWTRGSRINAEHANPLRTPTILHSAKSTARDERTQLSSAKKKCGSEGQRESVRADGGLNLAFVDVEVSVNVLHVVVLFERFDEFQHLLCL